MPDISKLTRRAFIASTGLVGVAAGGLFLSGKMTAVQNKLYKLLDEPEELVHLFVSIGKNNRITIMSHRVEMGQGIKTGLPLVLADELDADWNLVDVVQAPGHPDYGSQNTDSSKSMRKFYLPMRTIGASVRHMLVSSAAQVWGVSEKECKAVNHKVVHASSGRSLSYGELAELAAKQAIPNTSGLKYKTEQEFRYIGKGITSVDCKNIVAGDAEYTIDVELPNILYSVIEHAPTVGARLERCDDQEARRVAGVVDVVVLPETKFPVDFNPLHGVAIVATNSWAALKARKKLKCTWSGGPYSKRSSEALADSLSKDLKKSGRVARKNGDVEKAFSNAKIIHEATYSLPYLAHVPMEPPATVADVGFNSCKLWASSQNPQSVRRNVARLLNIPLHNVEVNVPLLGGGFGRKSKGDYCSQAALISSMVGRPVKLIWTREDDIRNDYYHAMSVHHYKASLDSENRISALLQRTAYPSISTTFKKDVNSPTPGELMGGGFTSSFYDIPNFTAEVHEANEAARIGWLRSVTSIQHAFANNSFIDELSYLRKLSPVDNLLETIGPDRIIDPNYMQVDYPQNKEHPFDTSRLKDVIRMVEQRSGFSQLGKGKGWGIAAHYSFQSYCAVATQVSVHNKQLSVEQVHIALDCGKVVNTDRVKSQLEGAIIFGLSIALFGKIDVKEGKVQQGNFDDYPVLRLAQCPDIFVHLVESNAPPAGVGEPGVPPVAPSVVNAVFAASGERHRSLPLSQHYQI